MMIEDSKIKEIIDKTDIVSLVSEFVPLQKRGKNYFGLCPFHPDTDASFSVSPEKKIAHCMGCGGGGNPINFLRKIKNISFEEAAVELANRAGIEVKQIKKAPDPNKHYYEIMELATSFYEHYLFNSKPGLIALEYLKNRGVLEETIKKFRIGLAPKNSNKLYKLLSDKGYSEIDIEDVGLVTKGKEGLHDFFSDRIMFPIIDDKNHILAFSGRIYYKSETEQRYSNSPETVIYKKGESLFNLNNALPFIRKMNHVILCEGQMDVVSLYNAGLGEVICSLGTNLTIEQANLIGKYTKNVFILYDGDGAGQKATLKAFKLFKGFNAKTATLPEKSDPDEFIRNKGIDELVKLMKEKAKDQFEFTYEYAFSGKDLTNSYDYDLTKEEVFELLYQQESKALIEKYLKRLSVDLKVSFDAIYSDFNIYCGRKKAKRIEVEPKVDVIKEVLPLKYEEMYLALSIYSKEYYDYFKKNLGDIGEYTSSNLVIDLYIAISNYYDSNKSDNSMLLKYCYQEVHNDFVLKLMNDVSQFANNEETKLEQTVRDIVKRFTELKYKNDLKDFKINSNEVSQANLDVLNKKLQYVRENNK